jgi:hypothetical protein
MFTDNNLYIYTNMNKSDNMHVYTHLIMAFNTSQDIHVCRQELFKSYITGTTRLSNNITSANTMIHVCEHAMFKSINILIQFRLLQLYYYQITNNRTE